MANAYTAQKKQRKANPNSTIPSTTFGKGGAPVTAEPFIEKNRTMNGIETADGTSMIPAKRQKRLRENRDVRSSSSPRASGRRSVVSLRFSLERVRGYKHVITAKANAH